MDGTAKTNETGREIAEEIRRKCRSVDGIGNGISDFLKLADRIEAAGRRDADRIFHLHKLARRLMGIVNHLPPAVTGVALMNAEVEGADEMPKPELVSQGYKRIAALMKEAIALVGAEEEEQEDGPVRIEREECSILSLVVEDSDRYAMIERGEQREYYLEPTSKVVRAKLHVWNRGVSSTRAPVVEFRRGYAKDAPRMAFWCFGVDTTGGMGCYGLTHLQRHPEWGEPSGLHFMIHMGGRVELEDGGAR